MAIIINCETIRERYVQMKKLIMLILLAGISTPAFAKVFKLSCNIKGENILFVIDDVAKKVDNMKASISDETIKFRNDADNRFTINRGDGTIIIEPPFHLIDKEPIHGRCSKFQQAF